MLQLADAEVHAEPQVGGARNGPSPDRGLAAGDVEHSTTDWHDHAGCLGGVDEPGRADQASVGVLPAHQGLDTGDVAALQADDRLVVHDEVVADQGDLECVGERVLVQPGVAHGCVVEGEAGPPGGLGRIHGHIGPAQDLRPAQPELGNRDADTAANLDRGVAELERLLHGGADPLGDRDRHGQIGQRFEQHGELVAAESGDEPIGADRGDEPTGNADQEGVAGLVAQGVVDRLEPVEVHEHHDVAQAGVRGVGQPLVEVVEELGPVRQTGQGIVEGLVGQLDLDVLELGDQLPVLERHGGLTGQQAEGLDAAGLGGAAGRRRGPDNDMSSLLGRHRQPGQHLEVVGLQAEDFRQLRIAVVDDDLVERQVLGPQAASGVTR